MDDQIDDRDMRAAVAAQIEADIRRAENEAQQGRFQHAFLYLAAAVRQLARRAVTTTPISEPEITLVNERTAGPS